MTATSELPSTARIERAKSDDEFFELQVLCTSNFRHLVALRITSESVNNVVDCLRVESVKGVRHVKARRSSIAHSSHDIQRSAGVTLLDCYTLYGRTVVEWSTALSASVGRRVAGQSI